MSFSKNKEIVRNLNDAVNRRDWERIDLLVHPGFVRHSYSAPPLNSREELKEFLKSESKIFPDAFESVEDMICEKDKVAVRHKFTGTQHGQMGKYQPSGKSMTAEYMAIYRIQDEVIIESWVEWDNLNGLIQLGHFSQG